MMWTDGQTEEAGTPGSMMCMEGSDRGGGDPGLYDGWKGPAPRAQRKRGSQGDAALIGFRWSGELAPRLGLE